MEEQLGISLPVQLEGIPQKLTCSGTELDKFHDIAQTYKEKVGIKSQKCYKT